MTPRNQANLRRCIAHEGQCRICGSVSSLQEVDEISWEWPRFRSWWDAAPERTIGVSTKRPRASAIAGGMTHGGTP